MAAADWLAVADAAGVVVTADDWLAVADPDEVMVGDAPSERDALAVMLAVVVEVLETVEAGVPDTDDVTLEAEVPDTDDVTLDAGVPVSAGVTVVAGVPVTAGVSVDAGVTVAALVGVGAQEHAIAGCPSPKTASGLQLFETHFRVLVSHPHWSDAEMQLEQSVCEAHADVGAGVPDTDDVTLDAGLPDTDDVTLDAGVTVSAGVTLAAGVSVTAGVTLDAGVPVSAGVAVVAGVPVTAGVTVIAGVTVAALVGVGGHVHTTVVGDPSPYAGGGVLQSCATHKTVAATPGGVKTVHPHCSDAARQVSHVVNKEHANVGVGVTVAEGVLVDVTVREPDRVPVGVSLTDAEWLAVEEGDEVADADEEGELDEDADDEALPVAEEVELAVPDRVLAGVRVGEVRPYFTLGTDDGDGPGVNAVPMVASPVLPHATARVLPAEVSAYSAARRAMMVVSTGLEASVGQVEMPLQLARSPALSDTGASASMQKYV